MSGSLMDRVRRAIADAAASEMNAEAKRRGLPPLNWYVHGDMERAGRLRVEGHLGLGDSGDRDVRVAGASAWAEAFGLAGPTEIKGCVEWVGEVERVRVEVWAITDPDVFYERSGVAR